MNSWQQHSEGLIATSGLHVGRNPARDPATRGRKKPAAAGLVLRSLWPGSLLHRAAAARHPRAGEHQQARCSSLGKRYQARYVATNDVHYINPEDARLQDILLAIQTGALLTDPNRFRMTDNSITCAPRRKWPRCFREVPEALSNTLVIAERCNVDLTNKGYHLPAFPVPEGYTAETYLRELCEEGLRRRYGDRGRTIRRCASAWNTSWASSTRWALTPTS